MHLMWWKVYNLKVYSFKIILNPANDGSSSTIAATSATAIYDLTRTTTSGLYWILGEGSVPRQVYCDMTTDSGGWTLIARSHPTTVNYGGENWGWKGVL
jgi:hypothetical protein